MDIIVSGRHMTVTSEMKNYVEEKINVVFEDRPLKITSVRVVLSMQKTRCKADIIVQFKHHDAEASAETYDMYESIDSSVEKVDTQIRRYLDKVQDHHKMARTAKKITKAEIFGTNEEEEEEEEEFEIDFSN